MAPLSFTSDRTKTVLVAAVAVGVALVALWRMRSGKASANAAAPALAAAAPQPAAPATPAAAAPAVTPSPCLAKFPLVPEAEERAVAARVAAALAARPRDPAAALAVLSTLGAAALQQMTAATPSDYRAAVVAAVTVVSSSAALQAVAPALAQARAVALDVEHSPRTFHGQVCLIQLTVYPASGAPQDFVLDVLQPSVRAALPALLRGVLEDPRVLKITHGGSNDVRWLRDNFGCGVVGFLDTSVLEQVLRQATAGSGAGGDAASPLPQQAGLATLFNRYLSFPHDKALASADWRLRPLTPDMVAYAAIDAHLLLPLAAALVRQAREPQAPLAEALARCCDLSCPAVVPRATREAVDTWALWTASRRVWAAALAAAAGAPAPVTNSNSTSGAPGAGFDDARAAWFIAAAVRHSHALATNSSREEPVASAPLMTAVISVAKQFWATGAGLAFTDAAGMGALASQWAIEGEGSPVVAAFAAALAAASGGTPSAPLLPFAAAVVAAWREAGLWAWPTLRASAACRTVVAVGHRTPAEVVAVFTAAAASGGVSDTAVSAAAAAAGLAVAGAGGETEPAREEGAELTPAERREREKARRAAKVFVPRASPLYSNLSLEAPDGTVLAKIDTRKARWYLDVEAADLLTDAGVLVPLPSLAALAAEAEAEANNNSSSGSAAAPAKPRTEGIDLVPGMRIRLRKQPRGLGHARDGDAFHLNEKANECVVCKITWEEAKGKGGLNRAFVLPHAYRQHFPIAAKSYASHDVVLTCASCHRAIDVANAALLQTLAREFDLPLSPKEAAARGLCGPASLAAAGEGGEEDPAAAVVAAARAAREAVAHRAASAAGSLRRVASTLTTKELPPARVAELHTGVVAAAAWILKDCIAVDPQLAALIPQEALDWAAAHCKEPQGYPAPASSAAAVAATPAKAGRRGSREGAAAAAATPGLPAGLTTPAKTPAPGGEGGVFATPMSEAPAARLKARVTDGEGEAEGGHESGEEEEEGGSHATPSTTASGVKRRRHRHRNRGSAKKKAAAAAAAAAGEEGAEGATAGAGAALAASPPSPAALPSPAAHAAAAHVPMPALPLAALARIAALKASDVTAAATRRLVPLVPGEEGTETSIADTLKPAWDPARAIVWSVTIGDERWAAAAPFFDPAAVAAASAAAAAAALPNAPPPPPSESGYPPDAEARIVALVHRFRANFLSLTAPRALPRGWSLTHRVFQTGLRDVGVKPEDELVVAAKAHFAATRGTGSQ